MTAKVREFAFDVPTRERLAEECERRVAATHATEDAATVACTKIEIAVEKIQEELDRLKSKGRVAIEADMDGAPVGFIIFDGEKTVVNRLTASGPLVRYHNTPIFVATEVGSRLLLDALTGDVRVAIGTN